MGCWGLAAVRANPQRFVDKRVGIIISGGNVDLDRYGEYLTRSKA